MGVFARGFSQHPWFAGDDGDDESNKDLHGGGGGEKRKDTHSFKYSLVGPFRIAYSNGTSSVSLASEPNWSLLSEPLW